MADLPPRRLAQLKRAVEFHQRSISNHVDSAKVDEAFHTPGAGCVRGADVSSQRRPRRPISESADGAVSSGEYLIQVERPRAGPLAVGGITVQPRVRIKRPVSLGSRDDSSSKPSTAPPCRRSVCPEFTPRCSTAHPRVSKQSPRQLPPLVYDGIEKVLRKGHIPAAFFEYAEGQPGTDVLSEVLGACQSSDVASDAPPCEGTQVFDPPLRAKSQWVHASGQSEWRACEILTYDHLEHLFEIRWAFGNATQKRVSVMQLMFDEAEDASARLTETGGRRDAHETKLVEQLLLEELSRCEMGTVSDDCTGGAAMRRILHLVRPERYTLVLPEVVNRLTREVWETYGRAQARSILCWRRPDIVVTLGDMENIEFARETPDLHVSLQVRVEQLQKRALIGDGVQLTRLMHVMNECGALIDTIGTNLHGQREPYSLTQITRTLANQELAFHSAFRVSWPERISQIFLPVQWNERMSDLVARRMEACLHDLCLRSLRSLVQSMSWYAEVSDQIRRGLLELTYVPPLVHHAGQRCDYPWHPLFRIHVCVEHMGSVFDEASEIAVESLFAVADTRTLQCLVQSRERFECVTASVRAEHAAEKERRLPDGGVWGGASTAAAAAISRGTSGVAAQLAISYVGGAGATGACVGPVKAPKLPPMQDPSDKSVLFTKNYLQVSLSAKMTEFVDVLDRHFQRVLDVSENFSRIDGYLLAGEARQPLRSVRDVHSTDVHELREAFRSHALSCCCDPQAVVWEVKRYSEQLAWFSNRHQQLSASLRPGRKDTLQIPGRNGKVEVPSGAREETSECVPDSAEHLEELLQQIETWFCELNGRSLSERHLGLFVFDVAPLHRALCAMCACCRLRLLGSTQRQLEVMCFELKCSLQSKYSEILLLPKTADELQNTLMAVNGLDTFLALTEPELEKIRKTFAILDRWSHRVPTSISQLWYDCIHRVPSLRDRAERFHTIFTGGLRSQFKVKISDHAQTLSAQCRECKKALDELSSKVSLNKAETYHSKIKNLQVRVRGMEEEVNKQHSHEDMMDLERSVFPWLTNMVEQIVPLLELWYLAHEWIQWKDEVLYGEFWRIDPDEVKTRLAGCTETMRRLEDVFAGQPRPRQVLHSLSSELTELRVLLPLIVSLRNPGLRDRHWEQIGEVLHQELRINQLKDMSLKAMDERFPFVVHLAKIEEISKIAGREMLIELELIKMEEQWAQLPILFEALPAEEEVLYRAEFRHEEVWELIADQMVKVKLMAQSPYAEVHGPQLLQHDKKLHAIGELCDLLHDSQYTFLQTREHLVSDGVVRDLLQKEGNREFRRFADVDKHWQQIVAKLQAHPVWLALLGVPRIFESCHESASVMEWIHKALHDVLTRRRTQIPLLYRLDDDTLLKLLLRSHEPSQLACQCVPGVAALDLPQHGSGEERSIVGVFGDTGEYLMLRPHVVTDEGMQLETWLLMLTKSMQASLQDTLRECILYSTSIVQLTSRDEVPLQMCAACLNILMTSEVEAKKADEELQQTWGLLVSSIDLCQKVSAERRRDMFIQIQLGWRDVVEMLTVGRQRSSYQWMVVLRHYLEVETMSYTVSIGTADMEFQWQYLSAPVACLQSTARGMMVLAHAFSRHSGLLCSEGLSVSSALSSALGIVEERCFLRWDSFAVSRHLTGAMLSGVWLVLIVDSSALQVPRMLATLALELHGVLDGKRCKFGNVRRPGLVAGVPGVVGATVSRDRRWAHVTMASYVTIQCEPHDNLPMLLLQDFRLFSMPRPSVQAVCEVWLSRALSTAHLATTAQAIALAWRFCSELGILSSICHRHELDAHTSHKASRGVMPSFSHLWSLCHMTARHLKQKSRVFDPHSSEIPVRQAVFHAFRKLFTLGERAEELMKLLAIEEGDSESDTEEEIRDAFLERGLHPTDPQVRATAQLHAWLDGDGVRSAILLGGVAVGKSSCIDAMHQAFADNWELLRFSAASLALCAADTQLSTDMPRLGPPEREAGLFESLCARGQRNQRRILLHMDGELTPALQGAFVSTLLGASPPGPLSRLHFSERSSLDLEGALHFAFELDSAASWSMGPDLVTRCGVIFLETSESDEDRALVDGWVQSLKMYGVVADLVERLCRTVLKPLLSLLYDTEKPMLARRMPELPRRLAFLHVRHTFTALFHERQVQSAAMRGNPYVLHTEPAPPASAPQLSRRRSSLYAFVEPTKLEAAHQAPSRDARLVTEASGAFVYSTAWGLAPLVEEAGLPALEEVLVRLLEEESLQVPSPVEYSIFDSVPADPFTHFQHLDCVPQAGPDLDAYVFVPTPTTRRFLSLSVLLSRSRSCITVLGPVGCGKTSTVKAFARSLPSSAPPSPFCSVDVSYFQAAPWTQLGLWERSLQRSLVRASKQGVRPPLGVWCLCVIDDCHCAPGPVKEAWRFALERKLVHTPGACASLPRTRSNTGPGRPADRVDREARGPRVRHVEDVMFMMAARSNSSFSEQTRLLRHTFLYVMGELSESVLLSIIGENLSHFVYVNVLRDPAVLQKGKYVELVHNHILRLRQFPFSFASHALFKLFRGLMCLPTEWLCELSPDRLHALMLHELIRETVDGLAPDAQQASTSHLAALQLKIFGGTFDGPQPPAAVTQSISVSGQQGEAQQLEGEFTNEHGININILGDLHFSTLRLSNSDTGAIEAGVYDDVTKSFEELNRAVRATLCRPATYNSPLMLALLNVLGSDVQGEACAVLSEDFCSVLLSLARLLRDTGGGHGGKVLLCTPCHCLAVSIVQALSRFCKMGLEVIDGAETDAVAVRARIKQGLFSALRSPGVILCLPTLFRPELLAVVQEALAEAPPDWYTEKERKECEALLVAFEAQHGIHRRVDEDGHERPSCFERYWREVHKAARFVLVAESSEFVRHLDAACPTMLRELAVVQQALLGHDGLVEIAHSHVSSFPWNFSESHDARTLARVATCIFMSTPHCHDVCAPEEFSAGHVTRPIEDLLEFVSLTFSLSCMKSEHLLCRLQELQDALAVLDLVEEWAQRGDGGASERLQAVASADWNSAGCDVKSKEDALADLQAQLSALLDEVDRCGSVRLQFEASETLRDQASKELELSRVHLVSFSKADQNELRSIVKQLSDEVTPISSLLEMCCIALGVSLQPTLEQIRAAVSDPFFNAKMAAVDVESISVKHVEAIQQIIHTVDRAEFGNYRALAMISNVMFPVFAVASTSARLPVLKSEMDRLFDRQETRDEELERLQEEAVVLKQQISHARAVMSSRWDELQKAQQSASHNSECLMRASTLVTTSSSERSRWSRELQELRAKLRCVIGDCLLSAAVTLFSYCQGHRAELIDEWSNFLLSANIHHSEHWSLCACWVPPSTLHCWQEHKLPPHLSESVLITMLHGSKWPLLYDPEGAGVDFFSRLFPMATRLCMDGRDFRERFSAALQATTAETAPERTIIMIENTYLSALQEIDCLMELLPRQNVRHGITMQVNGLEICVNPAITLIFATSMWEPLAKHKLAPMFGLVDFRGKAFVEHYVDIAFRSGNPNLHGEWWQLLVDRRDLVEEWQRLDSCLSSQLASIDRSLRDVFDDDDAVGGFVSMKTELHKVARKLAKNRDGEPRLALVRNTYDNVGSMLWSLALCCERVRKVCPQGFRGDAALRAAVEILQECDGSEEIDRTVTFIARRLWSQCCLSLPGSLILPVSFHISVCSAIPHPVIQSLLAVVLFHCPARACPDLSVFCDATRNECNLLAGGLPPLHLRNERWMEERRQRLLTQTTFVDSEGGLLHPSSSDKSGSERTSGADVTCACGPDTASDTADVADMWHASPPPDVFLTRATYFLDVVRACIKQVDDFDLERGDVSSGRRSSNVEGRPASLFDGSGASSPHGDGTSNGTQVLLPPLFRVERTASDEGRREEEHVVADGPVGRRQTLVVRDDRELLDSCGAEEGFLSSPRHVCGSATLCVDTTPLLSLVHRLERCLFLHTRDWIAWAEMCRSGLDASGQDRYPLLSALPQGFSEIPNDVSHAAYLQLLCLVVLLCHSVPSLCAGLEVFVRSFSGELVVRGHGLRAMTERTTSVQPIICLSDTGSNILDDILSLAEEKENPPKVVSLAMVPSASPVDLLEESKDLGHWAVLHASASEDWESFKLLERCWYFCASLRENGVDDQFRVFVLVDCRVAEHLPRWLFDSRAVTYYDGQTGTPMRQWIARWVDRTCRRPAQHAAIKHPLTLTTNLFHEIQPSARPGWLQSPAAEQPPVNVWTLRLTVQLLLAAYSSSKCLVFNRVPTLGVADSVAADEFVCQMLGADADSCPTVLDIIEGLVVLVFRQGSVVNDCCSPLTTSVLQRVLLAMQQTWMPRDFTHVSDDARDVSARRASVFTRQDSATETMEPQEQKPGLVIRDSCENVGNTAPVESPLLLHRLAFALDRAQTCSADAGQTHKVLTDAQSVVSLLPFAHTDSTLAVFECDGHETWIRDSLLQTEHPTHNARATEDEGAALKVIARSTNVTLDDIRVSVRGDFAVSSGCLSGSVVRDSDKCDFARLMDATVTCIESSPLLCPSVEGECTGSPSLQQRTGWCLQRQWHQQRRAIRLWAVALREEARSLRQGLSHSLDHLDERLRLKLHRWMHGQSAKLQECHSDWPATCPHFVVEVAVKAERVPVPDGWNHPSFSKSSSFGPWLQCVAFRLHDVYSSVHPQTLHLSGLMEVAPLLRSMQLDLSSELRVGIEETCLLYEPVAPDEPDVEVTSATGLADFPAGSLGDCFGRDTVLLNNLYVRGAWWSSSGLHVDRGIRNLMPFPPIRIRATLPEGAENALHAKYPATPACMDVPVWRFMRSVPGGGHDVVKLLTVRLPVTIVTDHCPVVLCDAPPLHMAGGAA